MIGLLASGAPRVSPPRRIRTFPHTCWESHTLAGNLPTHFRGLSTTEVKSCHDHPGHRTCVHTWTTHILDNPITCPSVDLGGWHWTLSGDPEVFRGHCARWILVRGHRKRYGGYLGSIARGGGKWCTPTGEVTIVTSEHDHYTYFTVGRFALLVVAVGLGLGLAFA